MQMQNRLADLPRPIAIVGLGVSGKAIHRLLLAEGFSENSVLIFDERSKSASFNKGEKLLSEGRPRTLIVSPGVPLTTPWIQEALKSGIYLTSELDLSSRFLTSEKVISVTGSVGKSTTVSLLGAALETFSESYFVGGNLGVPLAQYIFELHHQNRLKAEWVVLELSSYQLENFNGLKSDFSAITYLTANHLERYTDRDSYYQTKWDLHRKTHQHLILNENGGDLKSWSKAHSQDLHCPTLWTNRKSELVQKYNLDECRLIGLHNLDNMALAAEIVRAAGWPSSAYQGLRNFPGLSHRVENMGVVDGIRYINDSKATTMESVKIAVISTLESVIPSKRLHLLLGGRDKNLPWNELQELKTKTQISIYFFGECAAIAARQSQLEGPQYPTLKGAFLAARQNAKSGDSILLSPGGTSLDEFRSFEDRGDTFRRWITENE